MNELLSKLGWKIHSFTYKFEFFTLHVGLDQELGFRFITIQRWYKDYSLLSFFISLPNRTTRKRVMVVEWDLFFIKNGLWSWYDRTIEDMMYTDRGLTRFGKFKLKICEILFI